MQSIETGTEPNENVLCGFCLILEKSLKDISIIFYDTMYVQLVQPPKELN